MNSLQETVLIATISMKVLQGLTLVLSRCWIRGSLFETVFKIQHCND